MEAVANRYISLNKGVFMYLTKGKYNLMSEVKKEEECYQRFFTVNKTGEQIVKLISGKRTMEEVEKVFCESVGISLEDNRDWIESFLFDLKEKEAVVFTEAPVEQERLKVIGDGTMISPMTATIEVTEKCNLRCKHCYLEASCEKSSMITLEQFQGLVDIFKKNHVLNLELTGGEIFVHPQAYEILKLALKQFATVAILTNGTVLSEKVLELLKTYKDKIVLNISIDSTNPSIHDEFRGMKGAFEATCKNVKRMTEAGLRVRIASSIFRENMWEIDKLAELAISLGANMFVFNFIEDFGRGRLLTKSEKVEEELDAEKYVRYVDGVIEKYQKMIPIARSEDKILGSENCGSAINSIIVGADGNLRPCALFEKTNLFGNIFKEEFGEIFKRDIYQKISRILPPSEENGCPKNCEHFVNCKGCYFKGLSHNQGKEKVCSWIKKNNLYEILNLFERGVRDVQPDK